MGSAVVLSLLIALALTTYLVIVSLMIEKISLCTFPLFYAACVSSKVRITLSTEILGCQSTMATDSDDRNPTTISEPGRNSPNSTYPLIYLNDRILLDRFTMNVNSPIILWHKATYPVVTIELKIRDGNCININTNASRFI